MSIIKISDDVWYDFESEHAYYEDDAELVSDSDYPPVYATAEELEVLQDLGLVVIEQEV